METRQCYTELASAVCVCFRLKWIKLILLRDKPHLFSCECCLCKANKVDSMLTQLATAAEDKKTQNTKEEGFPHDGICTEHPPPSPPPPQKKKKEKNQHFSVWQTSV